jgi:hypothetical protein
VWAATFRFLPEENFTFTEDQFISGFEYLQTESSGFTQYSPFFAYVNDDDDQFIPVLNPKLARHVASGDMAFLLDWGTFGYVRLEGVSWDDLANRWITVLAAASTTQSDFANHAGGAFGDLYTRLTVTDARTGELIASVDSLLNQFNPIISDAADRTWRYRNTSGDNATAWLLTQIRPGEPEFFDENAVLVAAGWAAVNEMIDPLGNIDGRPAYQWFVGQNFPETVGGVRAWINFSAREVTEDSGDVSVFEVRPGRVSTQNNRWAVTDDEFLVTPYTSTDKP